MKKSLTFGLLLSAIIAFGQSNINYKALIKDDLGNVIANQTVTVQLNILRGMAQTNVYQQTTNPITDANGIVIIEIGGTNDFFAIDWSIDDHFLNVQIDTGSGLTDMGTIQFMAVPYAKYAESTSTAINDLTDAKTVSRSVYFGDGSGEDDDGDDNQNTAIGYDALKNSMDGIQNVAIGEATLLRNTSGSRNVAIGQSAMRNNISGNLNTVIGEDALYNNSSGSGNVAIGNRAGHGETGSNKLYIDNSDTISPLIWGDFTDGSEKIQINGELEVTNKTIVPEIQISTGAIDGHVLTSDASGNASWQATTSNGGGELEAIDEGNGIGYRLKGVDPANYGPIGNNAIDFSYSSLPSSTLGATGDYSTVFGVNSIASGLLSTTIGGYNLSQADNSITIGTYNQATGVSSAAIGTNTVASGVYSTALGFETKAESIVSTAIGSYNIGGGTADDWMDTDPLFEVGNGENESNRSNALTVLKNGRIGVATPTPNGFLHVFANSTSTIPHIELTETTAADGARIVFNNAEETMNDWTLWGRTRDITADSRFNIHHFGTGNIISATGDGNVGIGNSNPTETLDVDGKIKSDEIQLTTGAVNGYVLTSDATGNASWQISSGGDNDWTVNGNNMYSALSGNVGIGNTSPQTKLDVFGKIRSTEFQLSTGATDGYVLTSDASGNATWQESSGGAGGGDDGDWTINGSEVYRFGKVGINTPSPNSLLSVGGIGQSSASISAVTTTSGNTGIHASYNGSGFGRGIYAVTSGAGSNDESIAIEGRHTNGGVGVRGYTSGESGIAILGSRASTTGLAGKFEGPVEITGRLVVGVPTITGIGHKLEIDGSAGKPGGGSWTNTSDIRLKNLFGQYEKGLKEIEQLKTIKFKYKSTNPFNLPSEDIEYGFIAQEVKKIFPEAISTGNLGYLNFNMHTINVAMVNAIQELSKEKNTLKERVEKLEKENRILLAMKKDLEILRSKDKILIEKLNKLEQLEARLLTLEVSSNSDKIILVDK